MFNYYINAFTKTLQHIMLLITICLKYYFEYYHLSTIFLYTQLFLLWSLTYAVMVCLFITVSHLYKRVISVSSFSILRNILLSRHQRLNVYSSFNPSTNRQNKHFINNIQQLHHSSTKTRMHSIFILFSDAEDINCSW